MRRIIAWGSYDQSKPRVRLLLDELRSRRALSAEINIPVWAAVRDKAVASRSTLLKTAFRLLAAYPGALIRLLRQPPHSALLLPYPAIPDIFLAWPVARLRRHRIIFDAFISLHDTIVSDRALARPKGLTSKIIWGIEWLALRLADIILVDTDQHGEFFSAEFSIDRDRFQTILVGAEPAFWAARNEKGSLPPELGIPGDRPIVLFYGQLIPLHGLDAILDAISLTAGEPIHWLLAGSGQEGLKLQRFLEGYAGNNVSWMPWVDYQKLPALISAASLGLGIFGSSEKAARVIPNKVFQILAAGKPVITRESLAMEVIARDYRRAIVTVPAGDGAALAAAVRRMLLATAQFEAVPPAAAAELGPAAGVQRLLEHRLSTGISDRFA